MRPHEERASELLFSAISVGVALAGFLGAWLLYFKRPDLPAKMAESAVRSTPLFMTNTGSTSSTGQSSSSRSSCFPPTSSGRALTVALIDGGVDASAAGAKDVSDGLRRMQSGNIRSYAGWVAAGAAAVIAFMVWRGVR